MSTAAIALPSRRASAWAVAAGGVGALLARPWLLPPGVPAGRRVAFFVALGVVALWLPKVAGGGPPAAGFRVSAAALLVGAVAFAAGRGLVDAGVGGRSIGVALAVNALAAVAEEAFFRRHLYALLEASAGMTVAVVGTAVAFALVHTTVWGWWVLPLDLAAGLVLSWQRAATGRWSVPAVTHVLANTLALL